MKQLLVSAMLMSLVPCVSAYAVTLDEMDARISNLEDELLIAQEENADLTQSIESMMKVSGYVDVEYVASTKPGVSNGFRMHHLSLFFEKKWKDKWSFFSEIEYEDGPLFEGSGKTVNDGTNTTEALQDADGKIFAEAINLSYLWSSEINFRAGRFFTPAGIWSIDHYPPFVPTQDRPQHIRQIFPQLVAGGMVYGAVPVGKSFLNYELYTGNGEGNPGGKDKNSSKAVGLKASFIMPYFDHFELGGTYYTDKLNDGSQKTAFGLHTKIKSNGFTIQSEYATSDKDLGGNVTTADGYYLQAFYDVGRYSIGMRHDYMDDNTSSSAQSTKYGTINSLFVNYHFNQDILLKLEHHIVDVESAGTADYNRTLLSIVAYLGN